MYLIAIGWLYVALMMSVAEATNTNGSILGAIFTFLLYGVLPAALLMYILGTPQRRRKRKEQEAAQTASHAAGAPGSQATAGAGPASSSHQPDAGSEPAANSITPVREKP